MKDKVMSQRIILSGIAGGLAYGMSDFSKKQGEKFDYKKLVTTVLIGGAAGVVIKIHTDATPTGFGLTCGLGAGSAIIWNEVDTGSAPIDPPGWVDVAA